jgi:hypothetical protein
MSDMAPNCPKCRGPNTSAAFEREEFKKRVWAQEGKAQAERKKKNLFNRLGFDIDVR